MRLLSSLLVASLVAAACSAVGSGDGGSGTDGQKGDGDGTITGIGDGDSTSLPQIDGTIEVDSPAQTADGKPLLVVSGSAASVQLTLKDKAGNPISEVDWSTDDTRIGSVSSQGVFTANGFTGGEVTITAFVDGAILSIVLVVDVEINENSAAIDAATQDALVAGGSSDPDFAVLYPYSGTVFPRGVGAPVLQYAGTAAVASYVEITADHYVYRAFLGASSPIQATLSPEVWKGLSLTVRPGHPATVSFTKKDAGGVSAHVQSQWHFASASLKGIVYYSTYNYPTPGEELPHDAAIMSVRPGQQAEVVQLGCTACHTVSADGKVLAAGNENGDIGGGEGWNPLSSATYDVSQDGTTLTTRDSSDEGRLYSFIALSPDGAVGLTTGLPPGKWEPLTTHGSHSEVGFKSQLVDTKTGMPISSPTLTSAVTYAQYPSFSPDGKKVAFSNGDKLIANSNDRVLSVMDVDLSQNPPVFSNLTDVVSHSDNTAVAWPSFFPDGNGLIFHEGDSFDSSGFNVDANAQSGERFAEIMLKDLSSGEVNDLKALNGRNEDGTFYLPYGEEEEGRMNYESSVLPVAVGGYYWVLFTSRRAYGNTIAPGGQMDDPMDPWGTAALPSSRKKIWIAAIDVDYAGATDPSHPAFYLDGQTLESGNMRGFVALAPCRPNGDSCESGSDCCEGFCRETSRSSDGTPELTCVPPPDTCSNVDELCETPADCCNTTLLCVNNRCTEPAPAIVR